MRAPKSRHPHRLGPRPAPLLVRSVTSDETRHIGRHAVQSIARDATAAVQQLHDRGGGVEPGSDAGLVECEHQDGDGGDTGAERRRGVVEAGPQLVGTEERSDGLVRRCGAGACQPRGGISAEPGEVGEI